METQPIFNHRRFWIITLIGAIILFWLLKGIMMPFMVGLAIAYLLDPLVDRLEKHKIPRGLASCLVILLFITLAVCCLLLFIPFFKVQVLDLVAAMPKIQQWIEHNALPFVYNLQNKIAPNPSSDFDQVVANFFSNISEWISKGLKGLLSQSLRILDVLSLLFVTPVVAFYLLRDWDKLIDVIDGLIPRPSVATIRDLMHQINDRLAGFVRGQTSVCAILAIFYAMALSFTGLKYGVIIGLFAGILTFVPFLGFTLGLLASVGIAVAQFGFDTQTWIVIGVFLSGQILEGNFLTPKLVGDHVHLHPVWVIFAVFAGGALLGFTGVLLGVPMAATIGVLVRYAIKQYRQSPFFSNRTDDSPIIAANETQCD